MGINLATAWEVVADNHGDRLAARMATSHAHGRSSTIEPLGSPPHSRPTVSAQATTSRRALYNGNEYLEAEFAAFKLRAAPCNVNYRYVESELAYLIDNSDAKAVFFDDTLTERFDAVRPHLTKVRRWVHVGDGECPDWADRHEDIIAASMPAARLTVPPTISGSFTPAARPVIRRA